jgi:2,4-dienoyl-CoA reductase-like NADH-dependent reductase (Old Yellow Enzyme family)
MEVVEAVTAAVGAERTGVRISPQNTQVDHVANQLKLSDAEAPRGSAWRA